MAADPNMKCVCGYRKFRESRPTIPETVEEWLLFDSGSFGGFGSTPFGTFFGSGSSGSWGKFSVVVERTHKLLACEKCQRVRSDVVIGGVGVFGSYVLADSIYVLVTDITLLGCMRVRFSNDDLGIVVDVSPVPYLGTPLPLSAPAPPVTAPTPPPGAVLASVLRAPLPDVDHDGVFVVSLVDVCSGTTTLLTTISLESAVQIHTPNEADLSGIPAAVAEFNLSAKTPVSQPGAGAFLSIPFDKCDVVIEYDARFGLTPLAAGFTETGSGGTFSLIDGGVLLMSTGGTGDAWVKEVTLVSAFTQIHTYARYRVDASDTGDGRNGLLLLADGAPGASGNYLGMEWRGRSRELAQKALSGTGATPLAVDVPLSGWTDFFAGMNTSDARGVVSLRDGSSTVLVSNWGAGAAGGLNPTVRAAFGDLQGSHLTALMRNFVVSIPGRFMRSFFRSYAATATPVVRLYFAADTDAGPGTTARFRVRYGNLSLGTNPYNLGSASTADVTASFTSKNTIVEVSFSLSGLTAKAPFWFSVERVWNHVDDTMPATAHLFDTTVRSS